LGGFAGALLGFAFFGVGVLVGISEANPVAAMFGQGLAPSIGRSVFPLSYACFLALINLALLSIMTGILRRRWLGLVGTGLILLLANAQNNALDVSLTVVFVLLFLAVQVRVGLIAAASFYLVLDTLAVSPPLDFHQWYAGRALIALLVPLAVLIGGFYVSLGGQPMFGSSLREE
jgi:hypothetical protein